MLIPILYLKGVSTGDFETALIALLGSAGGLSASTIGRLKEAWSRCGEFFIVGDGLVVAANQAAR